MNGCVPRASEARAKNDAQRAPVLRARHKDKNRCQTDKKHDIQAQQSAMEGLSVQTHFHADVHGITLTLSLPARHQSKVGDEASPWVRFRMPRLKHRGLSA